MAQNPRPNPVKKITDAVVKELPIPETGNKIYYDAGDKAVKGFGVRVTTGGSRAFVLNYHTRGGRERRFTIGAYPDWKVAAAREEAAALKRRIDQGQDPLAELEAGRDAKTVADLAARFLAEHSERKNRASTTVAYRGIIDRWILPKLKHLKAAEVTFADVDGLHANVTKEGGPYVANRMLAALSKMFNLSIRWQWRTDNPAKGVERNPEEKRKRYLNPRKGELEALTKALAEHEDKQAADIIRLLLLTGARRGEALNARWENFDLTDGIWTKPGATTKQKTEHRIPLSAPARQLLAELYAAAEAAAKKKKAEMSPWVFPGRLAGKPRENIKRAWEEIRKAAGIPDVRVHDLRHSYASILVSGGISLPIIGALLGHTQPATTARYAHLFDDPLRAATERVGALVDAGKKPAAEITGIRGSTR
jgi:integrase